MTTNIYRFYWLDGTTTVEEAETVEKALEKAGYITADMIDLAFHQENVYQQTHAWIEDKQIWVEVERLPELEPKGLYGNDLLKAMELEKFYPTDSHFQDDVSMYGFSGILECLIGYCQDRACFVSQLTEKDDDVARFRFFKKAALVFKDALMKMNDIDVPEFMSDDQPYGDGKL
jgi:hypothetical protein